ncbi:sugar phosphate isomerase/epimerase family protein [Alkalihalobacillus trypoxylicola]|uniref:Xylose isomerase n=1 Tax=Alkalihalobacillus trypoxylicola TaxID=519424 RepID=A0A162ENP0_9BACI|nr:sugar phosphate isomerase/epimerase family protein [Alkalihalobacillus trypoxylicola]KYG33352.1 xylose isomerase [Alkalihalobacillus trypoxylicola]GAF66895.1 putative isomerase [Bacillus sp. TS-2]
MKFAFSRPTTTTEDMNTLIKNYQSIGYDGLQLKYAQYGPYIHNPQEFLDLFGTFKGVASGLIAGGRLDEKNQNELRELFLFSQKIGVERIIFCHGVPRKEVSDDDLGKFAIQLSDLGQEAFEKYGVKLSLHHHYNQPVMYRRDFDLFFDKVRDQSINLTVDTAHLYASGIKDIDELIYNFQDHIDNFHLKDFKNGDWKILGEGEINFEPIFNSIHGINYHGWVSADEESGSDILTGMKDCLSFMKEGLTHSN